MESKAVTMGCSSVRVLMRFYPSTEASGRSTNAVASIDLLFVISPPPRGNSVSVDPASLSTIKSEWGCERWLRPGNCPLVQRLGHLPLEQVIGVRSAGGQPNICHPFRSLHRFRSFL